ncbi:hypothetical protein COOONC_01708 [Cooperia oncophora]
MYMLLLVLKFINDQREDVKIGTALFSQLLDESEPSQFERMYVAFLSWIGSRSEGMLSTKNTVFDLKSCGGLHRALKHEDLKEKQNSRLDNLLFSILEYSAEKSVFSPSTRGLTGASSRTYKTLQRHKEASVPLRREQALPGVISNENLCIFHGSSGRNPGILMLTVSSLLILMNKSILRQMQSSQYLTDQECCAS